MTAKARTLHAMVASQHPRLRQEIHDGCLKVKAQSIAARSYSCGHAIHAEVEVAIKVLDSLLDTVLQSMQPFLRRFGAPDPDLPSSAYQVLVQFEQEVLDEFRKVNQDRLTVSEYARLTESILDQELGEFRSRAHSAISDMPRTLHERSTTPLQED